MLNKIERDDADQSFKRSLLPIVQQQSELFDYGDMLIREIRSGVMATSRTITRTGMLLKLISKQFRFSDREENTRVTIFEPVRPLGCH